MKRRYRETLATYRRFSQEESGTWDFSEEAAKAMFTCESHGGDLAVLIQAKNGYAIGKHWLDWNIEQWRIDIEKGLLKKGELLRDTTLPPSIIQRIAKLPDRPFAPEPKRETRQRVVVMEPVVISRVRVDGPG